MLEGQNQNTRWRKLERLQHTATLEASVRWCSLHSALDSRFSLTSTRKNAFPVRAVETDGLNIPRADAKHKLSQLTSVWGADFHGECADRAGDCWEEMMCVNAVSAAKGCWCADPLPPRTTNHWHSWIALTLMCIRQADGRSGVAFQKNTVQEKICYCLLREGVLHKLDDLRNKVFLDVN